MPTKNPKKEVFLIVDALALLHRAFHAVPPLQTKDGRVVNAVYGFVSILMKAIKDTRPDYVAVAFDRKEATFRHKAFAEYKAQREKKPDDLYEQIPVAQDLLKVLKIPVLSKSGFEADDVIATLCAKTKKKKNLQRIILTGDKDTFQLIDENTFVLTPGKGIKDTLMYDPAAVVARFGLTPEQMIDYKALRGDPSDNIPGVRGIGEVGASKLLTEFGTLENLYKQIEEGTLEAETIPKKQRANLIEFKKDALKAKELVILVADVPVDFELEAARLVEPDHLALIAALAELDFKSLLPRVVEVFPKAVLVMPNTSSVASSASFVVPSGSEGSQSDSNISKPASKKKVSLSIADGTPPTPSFTKRGEKKLFAVINSDAEMTDLVKALKEQEKVAIRTFFDGHFLDGKLNTITLAWADACYVVPASKKNLQKMESWLASDETKKICHNAKVDVEIFGTLSMAVRGIIFDTMLASYVLNPGSRAHEIEALVFSELARELPSVKVQADLFSLAADPSPYPLPARGEGMYPRYAAEAKAVWDLAPKLEASLKKENLTHILDRFELPLAPVLAGMERHGVELDSPFLAKLSVKLTARINELEVEIKKYAGAEVNVSSPKQLAEVLFEKLQIQQNARVKKTAGGSRYSTSADELEKLKDAHPIVPLILEHRELSKLVSTYVDALPKLVRPDTHRVHTTFNQTVTATGRLSSSDPNLQNIPIRTELGREIRKAFVAPPGRELVVADYSQIELRILAHLSEDPALCEAFNHGQDIHTRTASEVWGIPLDQVTKTQRSAAKAINFGVAYGIGANALSESAGISRDEARAFIEKYFVTFKKVGEYLENTKALAYAQGYIETMFGRRRYLPELKSQIPYLRAAGERMAVNAPIQGANADAIKLAMIELHKLVAERWGLQKDADVKMLLQVHDELVFEVKRGLGDEIAKLLKEKMEGTIKLRVPVKVDVRIGKSWGELEKFEDEHEDVND
jgi:DNA polymerase-1